MATDKLISASNSYTRINETKFSVVRYGNVLGSRGAVIPFFLGHNKVEKIPITDKNMTRFMITLEQAVELVWTAFEKMVGGEIFVNKIPSMGILDIAEATNPGVSHKIIGIRPGEKIHEQMISKDDAPITYEYEKYYKILPSINDWYKDKKRIQDGILVSKDLEYSSDKNIDWMTISQLKNWIKNHRHKIGDI